jgi:signal transduction histidine kinase
MTDTDSDSSGSDSSGDSSAGLCAVELFAAQTAHDLNNFLTGILGNLELMQRRAQRSGVTDFDEYLEGARQAASRAAHFTQRLVAFSGQAAQGGAPLELNAVIPGLIEPLRATGLVIDTELTASTEIFCSAAQLELAVLELLDNAAEAAGTDGRIVLRTQRAGDFAVISVIDNGPGMAPEILRRASEAFFSTRTRGAGRGLGLAIVERFARRSGGTLELDSIKGQGTTARLRLPTWSLSKP